MAAGFGFAALIGAAGVAFTLTGEASPRDKTQMAYAPSMGDSVSYSEGKGNDVSILPPRDYQVASARLLDPWDQATLGADSKAHESLLAEPYRITMEIGPGGTMMKLLTEAGLNRGTAYNAIEAFSELFDPRDLRPKHSFTINLVPPGPGRSELASLEFNPDALHTITVFPQDEGFFAQQTEIDVVEAPRRADGKIDSSLYLAATQVGVPPTVLGDLIHIFSFDVDFQREVQPGDRFSLLYTERSTVDGTPVDYGAISLAEMTVNGEPKRFYRFTDGNGQVDYYDETGKSVRRALLRTPIDGARISSGFGNRRHPILGYTRLHKGMDFAAPTGTPIYAAGDGVVEVAGWNGGFGKYVRIRHNGTYATAYAHMSRIDSRMKPGVRVSQRQVIGYVGTTGRSTGPHLHYEVHKNGTAVNPQGVKLPSGKELEGAELARFQSERAIIDQQYASVETATRIAALPQ